MNLKETAFNIRLNNHNKYTKKPDSILISKKFQQQGYLERKQTVKPFLASVQRIQNH